MFLQLMWFIMMAASLVFAVIGGNAQEMMAAALKGTENAIALTIRLGAGYLFFSGLMEIAREAKIPQGMERLLCPVMKRLMPCTKNPQAREAVTMNLSMNLLGVGNAATPLGIEAVGLMDAECAQNPRARHDLYMFLILNATSIQLLPTTVLALRAAAGSADVNAVIVPTLICTAASTLAGVLCGLMLRRREERHA